MKPKILSLPVDTFIPEIERVLREHQNLVVVAEPGAGKTTRIPPALTKLLPQKVIVLEPRRIAAIGATLRICHENNWALGTEAGYQIRFDNRTSRDTRLIFLTEAILARQLLNDSELNDISAVVFDEFHERSGDTDLALGLLRELQILGHPIKIIVMSATLDAQKISDYLDQAPIINIPGSQFEPQVFYSSSSMSLKLDREFYSELKATVQRALRTGAGDTLVFLPGKNEIRRAKEELESVLRNDVTIEVLHGQTTVQEQTRILKPSENRRVILATNIAESSITIDGVDAVVDSGLSRISRYDLRTGVESLELSRISQASAKQRSGRSSRQKQGFAFRMWSQAEQALLRTYETSEILRANLSQHVLFLLAMGVKDPKKFLWFESPAESQIDQSLKLLAMLGAIDSQGILNEKGRLMLRWPVDPRSAALLACGAQGNCLSLACQVVALLSERDILKSNVAENHVADNWESDLLLRLHLLNSSNSTEVYPDGVDRVKKVASQLHGPGYQPQTPDLETLSTLLLRAWPFRLCVRRAEGNRAIMIGGSGVQLTSETVVKQSKFFLALELMNITGSKDISVRMATGINSELLKKELKDKLKVEQEIFFDEDKQKYLLVKQLKYLDLAIESAAPTPAPMEMIQESLGRLATERWDWVLKQNEPLKRWFERLSFYFTKRHQPLPGKDEILTALNRASVGYNSLMELAKSDLVYHFSEILSKDEQREMEKYVPDYVLAPTGTKMYISYLANQNPSAQIRLQEIFGMDKSPILFANTPLVIQLLAPNYRPVQTTSDLAHFWKTTYFEVRSELKSRYPKHSWPDDPMSAKPVAKGRGRK